MDRIKHLGIALAVIISLFLIFSQTVYASIDVGTFDQAAYAYYIDPGTGSIIIQVLIGTFVGGLAIIGVYRMRVKNFLRNLFKKRKGDEESE
ncbi:MAG: hypothetical protein MUO61_03685 [Dehalococcoidia bacterium]|nr:hypothetical protein [Dehalococcoidia bacterium]